MLHHINAAIILCCYGTIIAGAGKHIFKRSNERHSEYDYYGIYSA